MKEKYSENLKEICVLFILSTFSFDLLNTIIDRIVIPYLVLVVLLLIQTRNSCNYCNIILNQFLLNKLQYFFFLNVYILDTSYNTKNVYKLPPKKLKDQESLSWKDRFDGIWGLSDSVNRENLLIFLG